MVVNATTIDGTVEQTAGAISGKTDNGSLTIKDALTQTGGKIDVGTGTLTLEKASSVAGDVDAATIDNTGMLEQNGGTITADAVNGSFKQTEGTIAAKGDTLVFGSTVEQARAEGKTAIIGADGKAVTVADVLTQTAGEINALTLTLQSGGSLGGTVTAGGVVAKNAGDAAQAITASGMVTADSITASTLAASGTVRADTIEADVTQTAGTINAKVAANGLKIDGTLTQDGGAVGSAAEFVEVTGALDQNAGQVDATTLKLGSDSAVAASVNAEKIDAAGKTLTQDGGGTVTVTGADGITAAKVVQNSTGTIKTDKVSGDVEQTGAAALQANTAANGLTVTGKLTQNADGAKVGTDGENVTLGELDQDKGMVTAKKLTLKSDSAVAATVNAEEIDAAGKGVDVKASGSLTAPTITAANLKTAGTVVSTTKINANVEQTAGTLDAKDVEGAAFKQTGGAATADTIKAAVTQNGSEAKINATHYHPIDMTA